MKKYLVMSVVVGIICYGITGNILQAVLLGAAHPLVIGVLKLTAIVLAVNPPTGR